MSDKTITVLNLLDMDLKGHNSLNIRCLAGRSGLSREIKASDINRPGLALSGFYESFAFERVQVFGRGEYAYLKKLESENNYVPNNAVPMQEVVKYLNIDIPYLEARANQVKEA